MKLIQIVFFSKLALNLILNINMKKEVICDDNTQMNAIFYSKIHNHAYWENI